MVHALIHFRSAAESDLHHESRRTQSGKESNLWTFELATMAEEACEPAIEDHLQNWLLQVEGIDGPSAAEKHFATPAVS
jgi:hypothetical protein